MDTNPNESDDDGSSTDARGTNSTSTFSLKATQYIVCSYDATIITHTIK